MRRESFVCSIGYSPGYDKRQGLPPIFPVKKKGPIHRPQTGVRSQLGHPHETGIGKAHRSVAIATHQASNRARFGLEVEITAQEAHVDERKQVVDIMPTAFQKERRLGEDRLTRKHRCRRGFGLFDSPAVVCVVASEQSNDRAGVDQPALQCP